MINVQGTSGRNEDLRSCAECTLSCFFSNRGEGVGDHGDEEVNKPEV